MAQYENATVNLDLSGVWPEMRDAIVDALTDELSQAEDRARQLCPVGVVTRSPNSGQKDWSGRNPGTLRDSIFSRVATVDDGYTVLGYLKAGAEGSDGKAFYAQFVELGTKKMPAQPFLRPAAEEINMDRIVAALEGLNV